VFPGLPITNNPNSTDPNFGPAVSTNRTALSEPGREVEFEFETPGRKTGPDHLYTTNSTAGAPKFAAWISQLNVTYTPLEGVEMFSKDGFDVGKATTKQPDVPNNYPGLVYEGDPVINGTVFVALVDQDLFVTPANLTELNPHIVAGPALYQVG